MKQGRTNVWMTTGPRMLAVFLAYVISARLGLRLGAVSGFATLVWPPSGIAVFALFTYGIELWPSVFAGAFMANLSLGAPPLAALGIATGNSIEAVVAVYLLGRIGFSPTLSRVRDVLALVLLAAGASTMPAATFGVASLWFAGRTHGGVGATWAAWWVGDGLGILTLTPLLFTHRRRTAPRAHPRHLETLLLALSLLFVGGYTFVFANAPGLNMPGHAYFIFPPLIWAALRFGPSGTTVALFVTSALAIAGTAMGHGPFVAGTLSASLFLLQLFLGVCIVTMLALSAAGAERRSAILAREEFLSVASHELRSPITAMGLQISSLKKELRTAPEALAKVATLERQTDRLNDLVTKLLDVSRALAGHLTLECKEVDVRTIADETVARLSTQALQHGSVVEVTGDEKLTVYGDPFRLGQIFENLISNAIKYGDGRPVRVTVRSEGSDILLTVTDQGIGIPAGFLERIFQRFERVAPDKGIEGVGLGLWIVRQVVTAMEGEVSIQSEPGRGTVFTVSLPKQMRQQLRRNR